MPSPFSKYTSEQVPQVNILPSHAQGAEALRKGLSDLGGGIGNAVGAYRQAQSEHNTLSAIAYQNLSKYLVQEEKPNDDNGDSGQLDYVIKPTTPAHSNELLKKVFKLGGGNMQDPETTASSGLARISTEDLKAWAMNEDVFKKEEQQTIANTNEGRRIKVAEDNNALAVRQFNASELEKKEMRDKLALSQRVSETPLDISETTATITGNGAVQELDVGNIFNADGTLAVGNAFIDQALQATGIKKSDLLTAEQKAEVTAREGDYPRYAVANHFAGNPKVPFNPSLELKQNLEIDAQATRKFIKSAFSEALGQGVITQENYDKLIPKGADDPFPNINMAYKVATEMLAPSKEKQTETHKKFFQKTSTDYGFSLLPKGVEFKKGYIEITGKEKYTPTEKTTVTISPLLQERARYEKVRAELAKNKQTMPFSFQTHLLLNGNGMMPVHTNPVTGQQFVSLDGKTMTPANAMGVQTPAEIKTEFDLKMRGANNLLANYAKGVRFGEKGAGFTISVPAGTKATDLMSADPLDALKNFQEGIPVVVDINRIGNEMVKMIKETPTGFKFMPKYQSEYGNLSLQAQTYRKFFIASGQETDKDNARLTAMVTDASFMSNVLPETMIKIVNAMKRVVALKVLGGGAGIGLKIKMDEQIDEKAHAEEIKELMKIADKAGIPTFEELKKREMEPKKSK
jgi:hypothetical protein